MQAKDISFLLVLAFNIFLPSGGQQGYAPGVPPQHYQQVPQMQQVPVQHVPVQHVPQAQQHIPMQQQVPVQQMHAADAGQMRKMHQPGPGQPQQMHHHAHEGPPQVLNVANIAQEKEHIAEHLSVPIDTSKMSEQELQFHYFKMHDADNNNKLDGCELIKSLIHWHEQGGQVDPATGQKPQGVKEKLFQDEELVNLIDPILSLDDANSDGFIDYPEFVRAQNKAAGTQGAHQ